MKMTQIRKYEELFFRVVMFLATSLILFSLCMIIYSILKYGLPAVSWSMISQLPKGGFYFGKEGGILNAILGSLYLAIGATIIAFLIGFPVSLFINIHMYKFRKLVSSIRFMLDVMWGIPSIVYGAFGFSVMLFLGMRSSLLAGMLTVTLFIIPVMIRSIDEVMKTVPVGLLESALSLGSTKSEISYKVYFKQCISGITTAMLLSFGRAIGDAASVLFTTGYTDNLPTSLTQPTATLPLAIFFQLSSPIEEVKQRAYASAVILTVIILIISLVSRVSSRSYHKHKIK
ncbi:MAG: ABC transporter permease subunit [Bacteroidales bacterium]|nr:ABC transporter permease subunit [Bacteroidales bacterium]MBK7171867.1 ABC transporter permease subunit [Bacteroidales bacterium]